MTVLNPDAWKQESLPAGLVASLSGLMDVTAMVLERFSQSVQNEDDFYAGSAGNLLAVGRDLSHATTNALRAVAFTPALTESGRMSLMRKAAAFNTAHALFHGPLRPRSVYNDYQSLYGASTASETLDGRQPSAFQNINTFAGFSFDSNGPARLSTEAIYSVAALKSMDPVLSPLSLAAIERHAAEIATGVTV